MTLTTKVKKLFAKKESQNLLSVALRQNSLVYCFAPEQGTPITNQIDVVSEQYEQALSELHQIDDLVAKTQLILSNKFYQIVQVDKPNIPENEMSSALKWQVKDLITIPNDDMVLDYFDAPVIGGVAKVNVVCAQKSKLQELVMVLHKNDINLKNITTEEFAFAQLLSGVDGANLLICQQPGEDILILIIKDRHLFSYRRIRGMASIGQRTEEELAVGITDSLSVEIQKSVDFFERQLKQPPVKTIKVLLPIRTEAFIARKLSENTHITVELLKLPEAYPDDRAYAAVIGNVYGAKFQVTETTILPNEASVELKI